MSLGLGFGRRGRPVWQSLQDVRRFFPDADQVGAVLIFNIRGNRYRLIATHTFSKEQSVSKSSADTQGIRPQGVDEMGVDSYFRRKIPKLREVGSSTGVGRVGRQV